MATSGGGLEGPFIGRAPVESLEAADERRGGLEGEPRLVLELLHDDTFSLIFCSSLGFTAEEN